MDDQPKIKFPEKSKANLKLRLELKKPSKADLETRRQIKDVIRKSRTPWGGTTAISSEDLEALEKSLLNLEPVPVVETIDF